MSTITVYSSPGCAQCSLTFKAFDAAKLDYSTVDISIDTEAVNRVKALGYTQAPVVVTESDHWSGFRPDKISNLDASAKETPR